MATLIKSRSQLKEIFENKVRQALILSQEEIHGVIQKHLQGYYDEYTPEFYKRTERFLNSLAKTDISVSGNALYCSVKFDDDYWGYHYPGTTDWGRKSISASGADVIGWANEGLHGGTITGKEHFWNNAMKELGGKAGIMAIVKKNFKEVGLPVA